MMPPAARKGAVVAVLLAATLSGMGAGGEEQASVPTGDVEQLRAYADSLVQQIEELHTEIARLNREREELARQLVEARSALEVFEDGERRRLAKKAEIARSNVKSGAGSRIAAPVAAGPVRHQPEAGIVTTADANAVGDMHPASTALPVPKDSPKAGVANRSEGQRQIDDLEAELRELRERQQADQANAKNLEEALEVEKRAGQSKLEALQSVLLNTRSASAQLREELEETRRHNSDLSHQVSMLHVRRDGSPSNGDEARPARAPEVADGGVSETKAARLPSPPSRKSQPVSPSVPPEKPETAEPKSSATSETVDVIASATVENPALATELREQLSVERERRETLEEEVKRLTANGSSDEKFTEISNALQSARSQILVLSNQLAEERKSREDLEMALQRTQQEPGAQTNADLSKRLAQTLTDRRSEAEHLAAQLKEANEIIVRLKGRLEASESPESESKLLTDLQKDNETLRTALKAAEEANDALRDKAEMAQRLAEMVYGKGP